MHSASHLIVLTFVIPKGGHPVPLPGSALWQEPALIPQLRPLGVLQGGGITPSPAPERLPLWLSPCGERVCRPQALLVRWAQVTRRRVATAPGAALHSLGRGRVQN